MIGDSGFRHAEREHPIGVDPCVDRARVEELLPIWPVPRLVDFQQRSPESTSLIGADVNWDSTPVDGDCELLAGKMRSADVRAGPNVQKAHRVGARAEME